MPEFFWMEWKEKDENETIHDRYHVIPREKRKTKNKIYNFPFYIF